MNCIIANFGDDSVSLIQWAHQKKIKNVVVLSVNTGWQAECWEERMNIAKNWLNSLKIKHHHLCCQNNFQTLVKTRKHFPSQTFSWCSSFLKGITILDWLELNDKDGKATIFLAHQRNMSDTQFDLPKYIKSSIKFDNRPVYYPLVKINKYTRNQLIKKTPFKIPLNHRSLECQPCIHFTKNDIKSLTNKDIKKIKNLENNIQQSMFKKKFQQ